MGHRYNPKHARKLNNEERRKMLPPDQVLRYLNLEETDQVLDLGAGIGYFSIPIAKRVKKVIAVEVSEEMLQYLKEESAKEEINNIEFVQHEIETLPFENRYADKVIVSLVLHEVRDLNQTLGEIQRVLKLDGKLMVIEWEKKISDSGPPMEERLESSQLKTTLDKYFQNVRIERPNLDQYILIAEQK
ncbi:class I SAM-dependent methyltransferase [Tepidibacillus marianensis]|uniref:class I SAM-dependent methyltransferase n=1 Tax=Tepidibacillus marianensis TaxID=3131995 RepID=UPI0030D2BD08